ncbi:MAG TPA: c-type cytochrome [Caulobacteraceae bacterium]|jgi:cytochrome c
MKTLLLAGLFAGALMAPGASALAADAGHGQQLFREQCGVCHEGGDGDGAGGAGPSLKGVVGRKVGGDTNFSYTQVLGDSKETWTTDSLSTFLTDPNAAKPGTSMPISVKNDADRTDLVTYLASLKAQ